MKATEPKRADYRPQIHPFALGRMGDKETITKLSTHVAQVAEAHRVAFDDIYKLRSRADTSDSNHTAATTRMDSLQSTLNTMQSTLNSLTSRILAVEADIAAIKTFVEMP